MLVTDLINVAICPDSPGPTRRCWCSPTTEAPCWPPTAATAPRPPSRRPTWKWPSSGPAGATWPGGPRPPARSGWASRATWSPWTAYDALAAALAEAGGAELVRAAQTVEALREIKDAGEVALLRLACEAADAALTDLVARGGLRPGRTEREVGRELEALMLDHGADGVSFETIVAAGANSAIPHHRPTDAVLAAGDFVKIDFGALVGGYHSDMTRTFVLGKAADWQLEIYELVSDAQRAGRVALEAGASLADVDAAARGVIVDAGHGEHFGHGLGHGVGLQIHEAPGINATAAGTLLCGLRGDRGARRLFARPRRRPHRGHAGGGGQTQAPGTRTGIAHPVPQGTGDSDLASAVPDPLKQGQA